MVGIKDLARHLDISIGTISRALNDKADVNSETRQRVIDLAAKLGYAPNQAGRSLRKGSTGLIGAMIPSQANQSLVDAIFVGVLEGMRQSVAAQGFELALFLYANEDDPFGSFKRIAERRVVDALVVAQTQAQDPRIAYLIKRGIPFAAFGRSAPGRDHPWVDVDFESAVDRAVARFVELGHEAIALVRARRNVNYNEIILNRFERALGQHGMALRSDSVVGEGTGEDGGEAGIARLLALGRPPTAVLAADGRLASGIYKWTARQGLAVGRDLSVLALNGYAQARDWNPPLSYYSSDLKDVGAELGRAVLKSLGQGGETMTGPVQCLMPVTFVAGKSEGPPPARSSGP